MELKLTQRGDLFVLGVHGDLSPEHLPALKAGLHKYLNSDKKKIVLNLLECAQLPPPVLADVLKLTSLAVEAKGSLAFVGKEDLLKSAATAAGVPNTHCFGTVDAACASLGEAAAAKPAAPAAGASPAANAAPATPAAAPAAAAKPGAKAPPDPTVELKAELAKRDERIKQLEDEKKAAAQELKIAQGRLANADPEGVKKLKAEHGDLKEQVKMLEDQVRALLKDRKKPYELEGLQAKVAQAEASLAEYAEKAKAAAPAPAAAGGAPAGGAPAAPAAKA